MKKTIHYEEELRRFAQVMRDYAIEKGIAEAVYEAIIKIVVVPDNAILFHRSPQNWIDRNLIYLEPSTKFKIIKLPRYKTEKIARGKRDWDMSDRRERVKEQICLLCEERSMNINDLENDFLLPFEIANEKQQKTREDYDWAVENLGYLLRELMELGYLKEINL